MDITGISQRHLGTLLQVVSNGGLSYGPCFGGTDVWCNLGYVQQRSAERLENNQLRLSPASLYQSWRDFVIYTASAFVPKKSIR